MKTRKLIILGAIATTLLYSCSNDRDEDARKEAIEKVKNSNPENFKLNQFGGSQVEESSIIVNDSIRLNSPSAAPAPPDYNQDPEDGGDPKDVPIPPRR